MDSAFKVTRPFRMQPRAGSRVREPALINLYYNRGYYEIYQ